MHMQRADEVDGDEPVPLRRLGLGEGTEDVPAGVVHQDVDRSEGGFRSRDRRVDALPQGDIAMEGFGRAAGLADRSGDVPRRLEIEIEDGDARAFAGEAATGRPADAAPAARDHDRLVVEPLHVSSRSTADPGHMDTAASLVRYLTNMQRIDGGGQDPTSMTRFRSFVEPFVGPL